MSVGKYLYVGEIREKIHLKSKDTQPSIQDNPFPTNQAQAHVLEGPHQGLNCLNIPPITLYPLGGPPSSVPDKRRHEGSQPMVGRVPNSPEHLWWPLEPIFHMSAPHDIPKTVVTATTWSYHLKQC